MNRLGSACSRAKCPLPGLWPLSRGVMSNSTFPRIHFRLLVLLSVVLYVGWYFFGYIEYRFYSPEIIDLMTWSGYGAAFNWNVLNYISYALLLAYGIVCLGLIYFKPWARECFLLLTILALLSSFIFGVNVLTEASSIYLQVMNMIDGFIIALIYFSDLKKEFKITNKDASQRTREPPAAE